MTPSAPLGSPHVSFPQSAFMPIRPTSKSPIVQPTPIQPQNYVEQRIPFSTFWNPFPLETPQRYNQPPHLMQEPWPKHYMQPILPMMQQTPMTYPFTHANYWPDNLQQDAAVSTNTNPKEIGIQTTTNITPEQQVEIDQQVAS